jgi:very-short-patch-repair endonuclease
MFRLDFAWPALKIGVEIEGGIWTEGAHGRPSGIERDIEKHNLLTLMGWKNLRFTPRDVKIGKAVQGLKELFEGLRHE